MHSLDEPFKFLLFIKTTITYNPCMPYSYIFPCPHHQVPRLEIAGLTFHLEEE